MNENEKKPIEEKIEELKKDAYDKIYELFGEGAPDSGFDTVLDDGIISLLKRAVDLMVNSMIWSASIKIDDHTTAKLSLSAKGIKVERRQTYGAAL